MRALVLTIAILLTHNAIGANANKKSRKTNSIPPTKTVSRYVDSNRGFSITLPTGWQQDKDALGTAIMAISKKESESDAFRENINVVVETLQGTMSSKDYFEASQNAIKRVFQDFKLEKTGSAKLSGKDFYWSVFSHRTPKNRAKVLQYVAVNGLRAYIVTCSSAPEKFDRFRPVFESSVKTFKFE